MAEGVGNSKIIAIETSQLRRGAQSKARYAVQDQPRSNELKVKTQRPQETGHHFRQKSSWREMRQVAETQSRNSEKVAAGGAQERKRYESITLVARQRNEKKKKKKRGRKKNKMNKKIWK